MPHGGCVTVRQLLGVVEMRTQLVSASTLDAATHYALRETGRLDYTALALAVPAVLLVDMGTTAFNSFFDWWRGVDEVSRGREADKVLVTEGVAPLAALLAALACYAGAAAFGLALAFLSGAWVLFAGALCLAVGCLYSGVPRPISRTPFGELFAGGFLGTALFLIAFRLQTGGWGVRPALASVPGALLIASILAVNNACDMEGDRDSGRKTLAILAGERFAAIIPMALGAAAFASEGFLAARGLLPLACAPAAVVSVIASLPIYAGMRSRGFSHETKSASMKSVLVVFSIWSLGLLAGLASG